MNRIVSHRVNTDISNKKWLPIFLCSKTFIYLCLSKSSNSLSLNHAGTVLIRPNLTQSKPQLNPGFLGLLWIYSRIAFGVNYTHWSVKQTCILSYHPTACDSCPLYIPNTQLHVASAFRVYFWSGFTLCVHSWFTWGLLWVYSGSTLVKSESKPRV